MRDEDIQKVFEKIKAPDSSVEHLKQRIEQKKVKSVSRFGRYSAIAAVCLLIAVFAVNTASANRAVLNKYKNMFMEYFYGGKVADEKSTAEKPDNASAKQTVETSTDGHIRTGRTYDFDITVYDTLSNISEESGTRMGCMYYSIKYSNPDSQYILVMDDANVGHQRYFSKDGEMTEEELKNSNYKKCIEMDIDIGISEAQKTDFYYNEEQSCDGKYYFAVRWYLKETSIEEVKVGDMITLGLFDYAFGFDKNNQFTFRNLDKNDSGYCGNHIWYNYHTNMKEKELELPGGYTLRVNAMGAYLCKTVNEKKAVLKKEYKNADTSKENKYIREVEQLRSEVKIRYDGKWYTLSELAPFELEGIHLNGASLEGNFYYNEKTASAKGYRWISAASFFETPIDIDKLETAK